MPTPPLWIFFQGLPDHLFKACKQIDVPGQCPSAGSCEQGKAEHTAGGVGSGDNDSGETWGQKQCPVGTAGGSRDMGRG